MKLTILLLFASISVYGQLDLTMYEPSDKAPYGRPNPNMPEAFLDFQPMIGTCSCKSLRRNPDGNWQDTLSMVWKFKYIMNGTAVQDESWGDGKTFASSIRQYNQDSAKWVVTFFSYPSNSTNPSTWLVSKNEFNNIVLNTPQTAPNGMEGLSQLTFFDISESGFNWKGEWISLDGSFVYPFWTIWCTKKR
jgi:hypothetical protein